MTQNEINQQYNRICEHLFNQRIKLALDELTQFIRVSTKTDFYYQLETLSDNYQTLLRYAYDGYKDPQQSSILSNLCASILAMADEVRSSLTEHDHLLRYLEKTQLSNEFKDDPWLEIDNIEKADTVFRLIWLIEKVKDCHLVFIRKVNQAENIKWYDKSLFISALTLSLLKYFDPMKIILLIEFVESHEDQVYQRAITGIILSLMVYDRRLLFYPDLIDKLKGLEEVENIKTDVELILMQLLQARETEKITREFEEEVLPDIEKMMPLIDDKLQLGEIEDDDDPEGINPKWKGLVDEFPGLLEKIEKFSKMQMEGVDVFMSTFQLLKRFDFFYRMSNWFVPFYRDHPDINKSIISRKEINLQLIESLEKAFYLCNSDKYSFALNFQAMPAQQHSMIVANFEAEFAQMKEMAAEVQLLDQTLQSNAVFIQYIQDLYRFFKLYPSKNEFEDVFQLNTSFNTSFFYRQFFEQKGFTEKLATFYFDKEHYLKAITGYESLLAIPPPKGEYYEKIAYSYQKLGRYKKAIEFYKMAELFDTDHLWVLKKLAWCSMKLKDYHAAIGFFQEASNLQPDDLLSTQIAQCYMNLKDFEQALQYYSKLIFFKPGNMKLLRPIAYCHFLMGKLDQAQEAYTELLSTIESPSSYDLMNAGHVELCLGNRKQALAYYRNSMSNLSMSPGDLMSAFEEDVPYLCANGIDAGDIPLIRDFLLYQRDPQ